jgi:adenylate cyclase
MAQMSRKPPEQMAAYDYLLAAKIHHHKFTKEDNTKALELLERAVELEPNFASAHAWRACTLGQALARGYVERTDAILDESREQAEIAYRLDENDVEANRILCEWEMYYRNWEKAQLHQDRAYGLNPNDPRLVAQRGELLTWLGQAEDGANLLEMAVRLDPYDAHARAHLLGRALFVTRRYEEALSAYQKIPSLRAGHLADMAACLAQLGKSAEAKERVEAALRLDPEFSIEKYLGNLLYSVDADREHHAEGLRKAGFAA